MRRSSAATSLSGLLSDTALDPVFGCSEEADSRTGPSSSSDHTTHRGYAMTRRFADLAAIWVAIWVALTVDLGMLLGARTESEDALARHLAEARHPAEARHLAEGRTMRVVDHGSGTTRPGRASGPPQHRDTDDLRTGPGHIPAGSKVAP